MKKKPYKDKALTYLRRHYRVVLAGSTFLGVVLIAVGILLPQNSVAWRVFLKLLLIQIGTTVLIASTLGILLSKFYNELRELTVRNEIFHLVDGMTELVNHPEEFETFRLLSYMEEAGLLAFYPDRLGPAQDDLRGRITQLEKEAEPTTVLVIGDTLRVLFGGEGPFTYEIHQVLSKKANVSLQVLLLNPNCKLALYRSESESTGAPFENDEQYREVGLFPESRNSSLRIGEWNRTLPPLREGNIPIEVKYYDCADYCFAVLFPDVCYTAQYLYTDAEAQVQTPRLPMLKYAPTSITYKRLRRNFKWIWENYSVSYERVLKSLGERPVVKMRSEGLL